MQLLHAGLDIGSTTAKAVILDDEDRMIFSRYMRHFADIKTTAKKIIDDIKNNFLDTDFTISVAGSGALDLAKGIDVQFTQEQIACSRSIGRYLPGVDVSIELGGEDAKLTFFDQSGADQRMNETCAGGTGAFLDQMAALLGTEVSGLNELARDYKTIYPIASRCGVFAKTDVQALLNDGASRADIAVSIFQAIVDQTISGLACGRRIKGNVAFLGGPLYFMPELRRRFAETLKLKPEQCIVPENPHLFVAMGAAISAKNGSALNVDDIDRRAAHYYVSQRRESIAALPPLFKDEAERAEFMERHARGKVRRANLADYRGGAYLGIDVGSTTTKAALIGSDGELLYSRYMLGAGKPVTAVRDMLSEIYSLLPEGAFINSSAITGYGEKLVQTAFGVDVGEVETVAHTRAADFFLPGADFVIDIGGQDMKCLGIHGGVIDRVFLNEACSSGCGSFLQSFAESLHMNVADFAKEAEKSRTPVDLGSRCTVFMNSRVRQAQKDGASISDISAGLVYSIVRNALYKVLKIKNMDELGRNIVVQGGTFKNNALLRAFELLTGRNVVRPDIPELMGAFGAALLARDRWDGKKSGLISVEELRDFTADAATFRCRGCGNACILTRTKFSDGRSYISGNRCSKGEGKAARKDLPPNLYAQKYKRLFGNYEPLAAADAPRGTVGIPRVLNMYEDYPYWFTFFTKLGFRVELSSERPDKNLGIDTIPSQTVCYPAKLVHRHIVDLLEHGVKRIFMPILMTDKKEFADAKKNFNCPIVIGYPDVAYLNIDGLREPGVTFMRPDINIEISGQVAYAMEEELGEFRVSRQELHAAVDAAEAEQKSFRDDVAAMGRSAADYMTQHGTVGIILAGHPYHLDPEVNHGIPEMINEYGVTVFTEDSVCAMGSMDRDAVGVIDQWVFHSRLYRAAMAAAQDPRFANTELVQLDSFGCGLDAISSGQTAELLERRGKLYTMIKIDESSNNGAVRIRIRSLLAAINAGRTSRAPEAESPRQDNGLPAAGTEGRTILCPPLSAHQFQFVETAFACGGLKLRVLPEGGRETAELGLRYVNNDMCYPAAIVVGQFLKALQSGEYDPDTTDCLYAQTGGLCRASNYVRLLRKALDAAGFEQVRVVAVNAQEGSGAEKLEIPAKVTWRALLGILYGDLMMRLSLRTRPYELHKGETNALYAKWKERVINDIRDGGWRLFKSEVSAMVGDFSAVPVTDEHKPRVGVVGEILVKYHAGANEHIVDTIESEGGEAYVPDLANFLLYCLHDPIYRHSRLGGSFISALTGKIGIKALEYLRKPVREALEGTKYGTIESIEEMAEKSRGMVSQSNQGGEGWLLTSEMAAMTEAGINNILCIQPFSCLPDHVTGKGVIKELKRRRPNTNVLALDFDASVSSTNQLNRIKLLMATSRA